MDFGKLHVLLVHFPIALGLAAALADLLWAIRKKDFFRQAGFYCLIMAAVAAIPTVITGDINLEGRHFVGQFHEIAETHEYLGIATLCVLLAAALLRAVRANRPKGWWLRLYGLLVVAIVVLITLTGHWGGKISFGPEYLSGFFGT